ncbi:MAG: hypothetical protein D6675_01520 [Gemmatimonadetes bacterium]|nr:MAG: hypothetical protein D6675_01520 [Gemmatimonadota bacterium]
MAKNWKPPLPKEHGAWGILIGSFLVVPALEHQFTIAMGIFLIGLLCLYIFSQGVLVCLKRQLQLQDWLWLGCFGGGGMLLLGISLMLAQTLFPLWGLTLMIPFWLVQWALIRARMQRTIFAYLLGSIGLSVVAPLTLLLIEPHLTPHLIWVWLLAALFYSSAILFVQYLIINLKHQEELRQRYRLTLIIYHIILFGFLIGLVRGVERLQWGLILVYTPITAQVVWGLLRQPKVRSFKTVGWIQILHGVVFILLIWGLV